MGSIALIIFIRGDIMNHSKIRDQSMTPKPSFRTLDRISKCCPEIVTCIFCSKKKDLIKYVNDGNFIDCKRQII